MEEINLKELLEFFISKALIMSLITIATIVAGVIYMTCIQTPLYKSSTTILLVNEDKENIQNDITLNQKLVTTYSEILKSRSVLSKVIKELKLEYTTQELSSMITVSSVKDTEIINVEVVNEDSKVAKAIANTTAEIFSAEIITIYNLKNIKVIDKAQIAKTPFNVSALKQLILYVLVGLVLSSGIVFIMFYFDTTIKSEGQIEEKLELAVLGAVPLMEVK